ncbi:hypothetical protein IFM89_029716 [Coptis chinensis]|uniref:Ubiquitin-like domain-containing protein n=1 Tax=Coptis chinensis TaxID=261450 RepID=A0A835GYV2_9MAGN|nr:hypothetical protein IFM89_029716 [Coptis chinensis]
MSTASVVVRVLDKSVTPPEFGLIQTSKGFVVRKQKLVYGGRELARNDSCVSDYGVGDENVLIGMLGMLRNRLQKKGKGFVNAKDQELICNGEKLDDQWFIDDICGINDAVIHLLVQKSAKVRAKPIDKNFEFSFDAQYSSGSSDNEDESNDE